MPVASWRAGAQKRALENAKQLHGKRRRRLSSENYLFSTGTQRRTLGISVRLIEPLACAPSQGKNGIEAGDDEIAPCFETPQRLFELLPETPIFFS